MGDNSATGPEKVAKPPSQFREIYQAEWGEICKRRTHVEGLPFDPQIPPPRLVGLAFSGGGIRSATICLGALQELDRLKLLPIFDYLSTVSGGGYVGGWWSAWLSRTEMPARLSDVIPTKKPRASKVKSTFFQSDQFQLIYDPDTEMVIFDGQPNTGEKTAEQDPQRKCTRDQPSNMPSQFREYVQELPACDDFKAAVTKLYHQTNDLFPPAEEIEAQRSIRYVAGAQKLKEGSINAGSDPLHHLRLYANYLTPRKGALSRDTWLAGAIVSRNLVFTWLILVPIVFAAVMSGRLFFLMGPGKVDLDGSEHRSFPYSISWKFASTEDGPTSSGIRRPPSPATAPAWAPMEFRRDLQDRLAFAAAVPLSLLVLLAILSFLWLDTVQGEESHRASILLLFVPGLLTAFIFLCCITWLFQQGGGVADSRKMKWSGGFFIAGLTLASLWVGIRYWRIFGKVKEHERRNLIIRAHVHILQMLAFISAILLLAGFGHLVVSWVFQTGGARLAAGGWVSLATVIGGWIFTAIKAAPATGADGKHKPTLAAQIVFAVTPTLVLVVIALAAAWLGHLVLEALAPTYAVSATAFMAIDILGVIIFSVFWWKECKQLGVWGNSGAFLTLAAVLALLVSSNHIRRFGLGDSDLCRRLWLAFLVLEIVVACIVWVIALGWTTDPNWLSLHGFYKVRLTRAYLGASNCHRAAARRDITESADGDDVPLCNLRNCLRGAPYHLINTTLNLVGGHDLTTAQRHAAYFTFSKLYCGSVRTGYRETKDYMDGKMTLGTAVAISGAAASPNMGVKTPSAALAMLMTLNNVRLGYWAPTPSMRAWTSPQARLWPYYTLREFLSQTNDLAQYCYLTDGGHFENTALYSLVERGCKYIVLIDCGADPVPPCFADMGDALRRCRMDFGTEIDLRIEPIQGNKKKIADEHWIVGTITYSPEHMEKLGRAREDREGFLIWIKPTLTGDEPADVRQYAIENPNFPQQTTADQWFDEAQFESYRKLGEHIIKDVFEGLPVVKDIKTVSQCPGKTIHAIFEQAQKEADRRQCQREQKRKNQRAKADAEDNDC